mgnify:CR=1 FL=1
MENLIEFITLLIGIPAGVVIIMHELEILGRRIWPLVVKVLNFKPFNCEICLSFWAYFITAGLLNGFTLYNLLASFIAGFLGYLFSIKFIKF